jgi:hypothetical protein
MAKNTENMPWMKAIVQVLKSAGKPMHYKEIAQQIIDQKLRRDVGATPPSTVNANISWLIKHQPEQAPFERLEPGIYRFRDVPGAAAAVAAPEAQLEVEKENEDETAGIIQAFGMFWRRNLVEWSNNPELLGQQQGAAVVNFCNQRGVYLLHDGQRVVYVGQASDQPMGRRLNQHTVDRLNGRWDRFSWFGISRVTEDGKLVEADLKKISIADIITTMEAILIEGLEPPQNRKRGDDFSAVEYLQADNPKRKSREIKAQLADLMSKLG